MTGGDCDDNDRGGVVVGVQLVLLRDQLPPFRLTLSPPLHHKASLSTSMPLRWTTPTALSTSLNRQHCTATATRCTLQMQSSPADVLLYSVEQLLTQ